jgi:hypothetical protein
MMRVYEYFDSEKKLVSKVKRKIVKQLLNVSIQRIDSTSMVLLHLF